MKNYNAIYKELGVNKIAHIVDPRVIIATEFSFPKSSILYWFTINDIPEELTTAVPYLANLKDGVVISPVDYYDSNIQGKFRFDSGKVKKYISSNNKAERRLKFLKSNKDKLKLNDNKLLLFNYGIMNAVHKYSSNPMVDYYRWYNAFNTLTRDLTSKHVASSRDKFVTINIPSLLPPFSSMEKYAKNIRTGDLSDLGRYKHFNLIELWRFLTPELTSLIRTNIPVSDYEKITLVFSLDSKIILFNLKLLASTLKETAISTHLTKYPNTTIRKVIYLMLHKFITAQGKTVGEIMNSKTLKEVNNISDFEADEEKIQEVELEKTMDFEVNDTVNDEEMLSDTEDIAADDLEDTISGVEADQIEQSEFNKFDSKQGAKEHIDNHKHNTVKELDLLRENKLMTKKEHDRLVAVLDNQNNSVSPYPGENVTVGEILDTTKDELEITKEDTTLPDTVSVIDKSMNQDVMGVMNKKYITKQYKKDVMRTFYGLQGSKNIIESYTVNEERSILGGTEEHVIKIKPIKGKASTIKVILPIVDKNGTFKLSGNNYKLKFQRADLPIRKIRFNKVSLSTYFGKLFITKASYKNEDAGFWFMKQILKLKDEGASFSKLVTLPADNMDVAAPQDYLMISRFVKLFDYKGIHFIFDYAERTKLLVDPSAMEKNGSVLCGAKGKTYYIMNKDNKLTMRKDGKDTDLGDIYTFLGVDRLKAPAEFASVKIFKSIIPLGIVLSYYLGFEKLLKVLGSKFITIDDNKRPEKSDKTMVIRFKDRKYVIDKTGTENDLILAGIVKHDKVTKDKNYKTFNSRNQFDVIFHTLGYPLIVVNELPLLEDMFIDHISLGLLKELKEPTNFIGLLIRAAELLTDDKYTNPGNIKGMVVKGYERIAGMVHNELVRSTREHNNKGYFGNSKITVNPYSILKLLSEDSTTVLINDGNPLAMLKEHEEISYLGVGGRSKETMNRETRKMDVNDIGIISETAKDSGEVGITSQLSAAPKLTNMRGMTGDFNFKDDSLTNVYTTTTMLTPYGLNDDVKRLLFSNIQSSHIIPINDMRAPYIRTGYEAVLSMRTDDQFVHSAEYPGVVKSVSKSKLTVTYKDGKKTFNEDIKLRSWTTKEESGACYTHTIIANLVKGDTFKTGDSLAYDKLFFEPDIFDRKKVIYKTAANINVMLSEDPQTYEDSCSIHKRLNSALGTTVTKVKSFVIDGKTNILNVKQLGDKVDLNDILYTMIDSNVGDIENLDKRSLEILQNLKSSSPKAKVKGTINKITVYYNCELADMSRSVRKLVKSTDEQMVVDEGFTGKVNGSYSIMGKPLLDGFIEIKYYIETAEGMGIGDKAVLGNQLKFTVGEVFDYDMTTTGGTQIDAVFSGLSLSARVVTSPYILGTTSRILESVTKGAIDIYFGN